jgi:integral membrane protein
MDESIQVSALDYDSTHHRTEFTMFFRILCLTEIISYLLLLLVAVPMKYFWNEPLGVKILGPIHGALFTLYVFAIIKRGSDQGWTVAAIGKGILAGILPLGPLQYTKR